MAVMYPSPLFTDCWEKYIRAAMRLVSTWLPTTRTSNAGDGLAPLSVRSRPPLTKSAHKNVLAGIWMVRLHGTMVVVLFIVTEPPQFDFGVPGQALSAGLTTAFWMYPVESNPWIFAASTEKGGLPRVGSTNGATARGGG